MFYVWPHSDLPHSFPSEYRRMSLAYQNHFTQLCVDQPSAAKRAEDVATRLIDTFLPLVPTPSFRVITDGSELMLHVITGLPDRFRPDKRKVMSRRLRPDKREANAWRNAIHRITIKVFLAITVPGMHGTYIARFWDGIGRCVCVCVLSLIHISEPTRR